MTELPYGFDGDEAAFGYYAYSLIDNLSDEYGNKLPLYFPSIGDYKYPVYSYLSTVPVLIFSLSVFSTRFLSIISGSLLVVVIYFLADIIFGNKFVSRAASFLAAVSPYGIIFSRGAYESNVATLFLALGILFLLYFQKSNTRIYLTFSAISLVVSIFAYSSARAFLVLFLPTYYLLSVWKSGINKNTKKTIFFYSVALTVFAALTFIDPQSRVRASDIGVFRDTFAKTYVTESIFEDGLAWNSEHIFLTRVYHNKLIGLTIGVIRRYMQHIDPLYLFVQGNPNMPKYSVPNFGLFYFFEILSMLAGIYGLQKIKSAGKKFLFIWIFLSIIPSALSIETPNPVRALIGLPPLIILSSYGVYYLSTNLKGVYKKLYYFGFFLISLFLFGYFWHQYSVHKIYHMPWYTDEGTKEMVESVGKFQEDYEKVVIKGDPYIHFLFHNKITPVEFLKSSDIELEKLGKWERVASFDKIIFKMPYDCPKIGRENVLYVCGGEEVPINSVVKDVVYYKDGKPAYILLEFVRYSERKEAELPSRVHYMVETDLNFKEALLAEDSGRYW